MPFEKIALGLAEQLAQAQAKIAELESTIAKIRTDAVTLQPPSFILESITDAFVAVDHEFRTFVSTQRRSG
jgi:hypothetical protein